MEENQKEEKQEEVKQVKKTPKALIATTAAMGVTIIIGAVVIVNLLNREEPSEATRIIGMEANIVTNEDDAAGVRNEPFSFTTYYQRDIFVTDGDQAECFIGNSDSNYYEDMYIQIFLNDENDQPDEELYVSKIIPRGSHIEAFETNRKLEPGDYRATLVHSCVNEEGELTGDMPVIVDIHVAEQ